MPHPSSVRLALGAAFLCGLECADSLTHSHGEQSHLRPCGGLPPVRQADLERPISAVLREHGGVDGHCLFSSVDARVAACGDARGLRNYVVLARELGGTYAQSSERDRAEHPGDPLVFAFGNGTRVLRTHYRAAPYDDAYCEANGWMHLPRERVSDFAYWQRLGELECRKLFVMYPEFKDLTVDDMLRSSRAAGLEIQASAQAAGGGPAVINMMRHAAAKCLIGDLACDMANCAVNFCRLDEDGNMGHGEDECGDIPSLPQAKRSPATSD